MTGRKTAELSIFGQLGVLDWKADTSTTVAGAPVGDQSGQQFLVGVGARYTFSSGLSLITEYERASLLDSVSAGASWRF